MDILEIFGRHFKQMQGSDVPEFYINGIGYKGAWPKNESMPLFINELMDQIEVKKDKESENARALNAKIASLEAEISDPEDELAELKEAA
jgi:hypothetical protein